MSKILKIKYSGGTQVPILSNGVLGARTQDQKYTLSFYIETPNAPSHSEITLDENGHPVSENIVAEPRFERSIFARVLLQKEGMVRLKQTIEKLLGEPENEKQSVN
jgi:hypothetical protein